MAVRLKNRWESPIGGYQFVDAPISAEPIIDWGFESLVAQVYQRRQSNPRFKLTTDLEAIRREVDLQNALRMQAVTGGERWIVGDNGLAPPVGGSPNFPTPRSPRRGVVAAAKNVSAGVGVLIDWLGQGAEPVDQALAEKRAAICAGCPKNQPKDFFSYFTELVAKVIHKQIAMRHELELKTAVDEQLQVCDACGCTLKLKVFVPLEHIVSHMSDKVKGELDGRCWINHEK